MKMECTEIQALLSEYLDRTLKNDLNRIVKDHLLSCKNCSNEYFSIKKVVSVLGNMEKLEVPKNFLDNVNMGIESQRWYKKVFNLLPPLGTLKIPLEFATLATAAALVFLIFTNIQTNRNRGNIIHESEGSKTSLAEESNQGLQSSKPVLVNFFIRNNKGTGPLSNKNVVTVASGTHSNDHDISDIFGKIESEESSVNQRSPISDINDIILSMGGNVISREYNTKAECPDAITVKIPYANYDQFINKIQKIGYFDPPAPSLNNKHSDSVLLRVKLNLPE